jgi:hypothetical protein
MKSRNSAKTVCLQHDPYLTLVLDSLSREIVRAVGQTSDLFKAYGVGSLNDGQRIV